MMSVRLKHTLALVACFTLIHIAKAQNDTIQAFLDRIEKSTNYAENIESLENKLSQNLYSQKTKTQLGLQLINNYIQLQNYDKALQLAQKGVVAAKKNYDSYAEASFYQALAKVYYYLKQNDKFLQYNSQSLVIASSHPYYDLLKKAYHNLGVVALESYKLQQAENYFLQAIAYGKKNPATLKDNLARNYRLLGTTYDTQGKFSQADSAYNLAGAIYNSFHDSLGMAEVLIFRARLNHSLKQYDKALELVQQSLDISRAKKNSEYLQTALSVFELVQADLGRFKDAYEANQEILRLEIGKSKHLLSKEMAESEAKFKIEELRNKQEVSELRERQKREKYVFTLAVVFLAGLASLAFIYQKRLNKKERELQLKSLQEVHLARENERSRLAKDLHDNMGAYTTSLLAQIDTLDTGGTDKQFRLKNLRSDAENIMATLRETIWILKTRNLSTDQFFDLVKTYVSKHLGQTLEMKLEFEEEIQTIKELNPSTTLNLYRIVQEIVQNIAKHANANKVLVKLVSKEFLLIQIKDNGVGFEFASQTNKSGLENIAFRAQEIGCQLSVESLINQGTSVTIKQTI